MDRSRKPAFSGANHQSVSRSNRSVIFRALHALAPISRIELARESGLNPGTVTNIVEELIGSGLVQETVRADNALDIAKRVGRRRILLQVKADSRYAIGIDLARNTISGAVIDLSGQIVASVSEPTGELVSRSAIRQVLHVIEQLVQHIPADARRRVVGVGVGAPGALSIRSGTFQPPPSYGSWEGIDLRKDIQGASGFDTTIDNNGNTSALAELWFGAGAGLSNFVLLNLGTGVGAGFVLDGDLYRGEHDLAAEIGHVSIAMDGARCACGNYGCLEMFVSVPRVLAAAQAALQAGEPTSLRNPDQSAAPITLDRFLKAVAGGDSLANRVMSDTARYLAAGIVNIINMLDPEAVFIGRELARAGDVLLDPVREEVKRRVLPVLRPTVRIEASTLDSAPVIGAGILALQNFFDAPLM
ncbi:MAG: ROK family transcriptional regulator [Thermomicrobiales bacterium]